MMNTLTQVVQPSKTLLPAKLDIDWPLLTIVIALISIGLLMVATASMEFAAEKYMDPWYIVKKQAMFFGLAIMAGTVVALIPVRWWQEYSWILLLLGVVLLVLVLVPGIGREANYSRRWLMLGPVAMQASEACKFLLIIFFSNYLSHRHQELKNSWQGMIKPLAIVAVVAVLLLGEPDFGGAVVISTTIVAMMFIAGIRFGQFLLLVLLGVTAVTLMVMSADYRMERLAAYLDPWAHQFEDAYQLVQSLIGFGQGQWFGVGLGHSVQKMLYLPDAHTDFIFSIVAEEFGFIGTVGLIALFVALVVRILKISKRAMLHQNSFICFATFGIAVLFAIQVFINMGVASGLLPTKGLTLPFISYGGSSLIVSCALIALVLRFEWELLSQPVKRSKSRR